MRRLLVLVVALAVAACGADVTVDAAQTPPPPPDPAGPGPTTVAPPLDDLDVVLPRDCPQPFEPVHAVAGVYGRDPSVVGVLPPEGPSIDVLRRMFGPPDTDGDGTPDQVLTEGAVVVVRRASGDVRFARTSGVVGLAGGATSIGDLDGDGRDDLLVYTDVPGDPGTLETYVVSGTVAAGTHDPGTVGVRLPWQPNDAFLPVGDHDLDGADDVVSRDADGPAVVSGRVFLAPGPGGAVAEPLPSLRDVPDTLLGVVQLASDAAPVFATAIDVGGDPASRIEVTLHTEPPVRLRIAGIAPSGGGWGDSGTVGGYRSGADRIVTYRFDGGRSGYVGTWYWNLDDLCAGFAAAPAPPRPTVADPRAVPGGALPETG